MPKMNLSFKINLSELSNPIKGFLNKTPWFIAKKSFGLFWVAFLAIILIDGFMFYKYLYKVNVRRINVEVKQVQVDSSEHSQFLNYFGQRKAIYQQGEKEYTNIFFRP